MSFFNSIVSWFFRQRIEQIEFFKSNPIEAQYNTFIDLIGGAAQTEWGVLHKYDTITTIAEFKNQVPLQDYESLKPYIERTFHGEQNILWHSTIQWFAKSSGTTADKSKYIPITQESLQECHYKGGKDLLTLYCNNKEETNLFKGKGLIMGGSHQINPVNENSAYGDLSAVLNQNMPWLGQMIRTPELEVALMNNWEQKLDKIIETTINQDITHIAGVPTWTIILLNKLLEKSGKKNIFEIWPNLELYIHGGVSFTPYQAQFNEIFKYGNINLLQTYNASEGFFGIQDTLGASDMLLMLDYGIFYEFIPIENINDDQPKTIGLEEVSLYSTYALVISTNGGLWRYRIGDTITFTSLHPFKIKVAGRTKNFINAFGEELMVHNSDEALAYACLQTNASVTDYTACPIYISAKNKGQHQWLIEFDQEPNDINAFNTYLDKKLQELNSDYEAKRSLDIAMIAPLINIVPKNTFYNWLKSKQKLGGQHKVPRLSTNDRKIVEEILANL